MISELRTAPGHITFLDFDELLFSIVCDVTWLQDVLSVEVMTTINRGLAYDSSDSWRLP